MAKFLCICGYLIADQTSDLPYKAAFFADEDYNASFEKFVSLCVDLIDARDKEELVDFIRNHFGEGYPQNLKLEDMIGDLLSGMEVIFGHPMYECSNCGRLWIRPVANENKHVSYMPETKYRGILRSDKYKQQTKEKENE